LLGLVAVGGQQHKQVSTVVCAGQTLAVVEQGTTGFARRVCRLLEREVGVGVAFVVG